MAWSEKLWPSWSSNPTPETQVAPPPAADAASRPKPCCVCKDEKAQRDECMLYTNSPNPQEECKSTVDKYKACMAGFGFQI